MPRPKLIAITTLSLVTCALSASAQPTSELHDDARAAIKQAATFFRQNVSVGGGYVYFYSLDLQQRWGEGLATAQQIWVQPPGTPTVGIAFLRAYRATGDKDYLDAAQAAAEALVFGQLRSGGWTNQIDLQGRLRGFRYSGGQKRRDGTTSLDDGQTQSALQLMVLVDEALQFRNPQIHQSAMTALDALLAAQFPNGGFPQGWKQPVTHQRVLPASYPDYDWRTEGRVKNYWDMYTINDNVCGYAADTLIEAFRVYQDPRYLRALRQLGEFLLLAQMPEPQPAWAQQYNYEMHPIWGRKFEPAAIAGDESQKVIETLMKISLATKDPKYLQPIPRALAYLKQSLLPDGRLARYYELQTNRPLYMTRRSRDVYQLTYDDAKLPTHYGWKWKSRLDELEQKYALLQVGDTVDRPPVDGGVVGRIIAALDDRGRWISTYQGERLIGQAKMPVGTAYLSSEVFSHNITTLSEFLAAPSENPASRSPRTTGTPPAAPPHSDETRFPDDRMLRVLQHLQQEVKKLREEVHEIRSAVDERQRINGN